MDDDRQRHDNEGGISIHNSIKVLERRETRTEGLTVHNDDLIHEKVEWKMYKRRAPPHVSTQEIIKEDIHEDLNKDRINENDHSSPASPSFSPPYNNEEKTERAKTAVLVHENEALGHLVEATLHIKDKFIEEMALMEASNVSLQSMELHVSTGCNDLEWDHVRDQLWCSEHKTSAIFLLHSLHELQEQHARAYQKHVDICRTLGQGILQGDLSFTDVEAKIAAAHNTSRRKEQHD